jgi:ribonuclease VapC
VTRRYVLDASALLAVVFNEPGADRVCELLDDSSIHALNLAEALRKMVAMGMPADEVIAQIGELNLTVIEHLGTDQSHEIARMAMEAKRLGLSIGDCVCLTTAVRNAMTALTADKRWREVRGQTINIELIR